MKNVCFGSGEFGVPTFDSLRARHQIVAVVTQPDRPAGRKRVLTPTPVAQWAAAAGLHTIKSPDVNTADFTAQIAGAKPDAAVVIAFGQKLGPDLIACFRSIAMNLHSSLLPKFRGAAPINWAILTGETRTGLTVISLAQRMDAGLIYAQVETPIDPNETAGELHDRLALLGPGLVLDVLTHAQNQTLGGTTQDDTLATRAPKLTRRDALVDFNADPQTVRRRIHGLTPWPGVKVAWHKASPPDTPPNPPTPPTPLAILRVTTTDGRPSDHQDVQNLPAPGTILPDHRIAVRNGAVKILELQLPGRRPMGIQEFVRGHRLTPGDRLTPLDPT